MDRGLVALAAAVDRLLQSDTTRIVITAILPALFLIGMLSLTDNARSRGLPFRSVADFVQVCRSYEDPASDCWCLAKRAEKAMDRDEFYRVDMALLARPKSAPYRIIVDHCVGRRPRT